jgi:anti-anti-sigma regulatory factor
VSVVPRSPVTNPSTEVFAIQREGDTLILTPLTNLRELAFRQIEAGTGAIVDLLKHGPYKHVLVDFQRTDEYGTRTLGFCLKLRKTVRSWDGQLALCNISQPVKEMFQRTKLDCLWTICGSQAEAMQAVQA